MLVTDVRHLLTDQPRRKTDVMFGGSAHAALHVRWVEAGGTFATLADKAVAVTDVLLCCVLGRDVDAAVGDA